MVFKEQVKKLFLLILKNKKKIANNLAQVVKTYIGIGRGGVHGSSLDRGKL